MTLSAAEARRWQEGFAAAAAADRAARRREGADPQRSIALALSLIEAMRQTWGRMPVDPRRAASEGTARAAWQRLRERAAP